MWQQRGQEEAEVTGESPTRPVSMELPFPTRVTPIWGAFVSVSTTLPGGQRGPEQRL